ncbi:hypothetical protein RYH80_05860 [Halobaculum sp. MBLA0147]|uniref:DUF7114 family protein n=1 Tax=Halobaculum sp. MBLA0147 TaxID=3079934 RepID=UPI003525D4A4
MDDAVRVREAAEEALADIEPAGLHDTLRRRLADSEMTPGVLTLRSARALAPDRETLAIAERAAGVQLIYEGLRLTRRLSHDPPWAALDGTTDEGLSTDGAGAAAESSADSVTDLDGAGDSTTSAEAAVDPTADPNGVADPAADPTAAARVTPDGDAIAADLGVLAADVFVARGFYLLARTEAAHDAVEVVRRFGRDQTLRRSAADPTELDRELEADVFELAVVAGSSAVTGDAPDGLRSYAAGLARDAEGLPPVHALPESAPDRIAAIADDDRVASSADS